MLKNVFWSNIIGFDAGLNIFSGSISKAKFGEFQHVFC